MSELTLNGRKLKWMNNFQSWVWMGLKPPKQEDYDALESFVYHGGKGEVNVDEKSIVGRWNPHWDYDGNTAHKYGGIGSETYEVKKVGTGVFFRPENDRAIFHVNPDGEFVHGVVDYPRTGRAFYRDKNGTVHAGPKPGSKAERRLGNGSYFWNEKRHLWDIDRGS